MSSGRLSLPPGRHLSYQAARVALWRPKLIAEGRGPGRTFQCARPDQTLGDIETIDAGNLLQHQVVSARWGIISWHSSSTDAIALPRVGRCHSPLQSPLSHTYRCDHLQYQRPGLTRAGPFFTLARVVASATPCGRDGEPIQ
jgi:hypothetical protein